MRLTQSQRDEIRAAVATIVGIDSRIWLFGSRADDHKRGGDIDLLIETPKALPNRTETLCQLEGRLIMKLGDRKMDILIKDAQTPELPIHQAALAKGVLL